MITPEMRASGWRECPTDAVRKAWEAKGGRWSICWDDGSITTLSTAQMRVPHEGEFSQRVLDLCAWRPVHPSTWDYAAEGWLDNFPKGPGLWWRKEIPLFPVLIRLLDDYGIDPVLVWSALNSDAFGEVADDGQWIAPCVKPGVV